MQSDYIVHSAQLRQEGLEITFAWEEWGGGGEGGAGAGEQMGRSGEGGGGGGEEGQRPGVPPPQKTKGRMT